MATEHISVEALIQGIQLKDPRLYQILHELNQGLILVQEELNPLVFEAQQPPVVIAVLPPPTTFTFIFTPVTVRLFWSEVQFAFGYEVRKGTDWDTATFVFRNNSLQADIDPLLVGVHNYLIKSINAAGVASAAATPLVITVPAVGSVTLQSVVIDNNVLLRWDPPASTFRILHYKAYRNHNFSGTVDSTFFSFFENVAGFYTYGIVPVDMAGNEGPIAEVTVEVATPPDYALQDTRVSGLNGTRVNVIRMPTLPSLVCCWATETWDEHFATRSWATIQAQISAGFPIYIQPTVLTGSYEEVVDYGVVIQNTIISVTYNFIVHAPSTTVVVKIATSTDGITYTPFVSGASFYAPSMRYLKVRLEFTAADTHAVYELYNLTFALSVKRENDGGEVNALSSDVGGTQVNFNKAFKDIESITATTKSITEPFTVIFDFVDIPNPVGFKVYVFDTTGNRVTKIVDWKARGII